MITLPSWWANIYVGLKCKDKGITFDIEDLRWTCQEYCNQIGFCVSFTPTTFIYSNGNEPGVIVGCIQYPRFPKPDAENKERVTELARRLQRASEQYRVTIVFPDEVVMLERENDV